MWYHIDQICQPVANVNWKTKLINYCWLPFHHLVYVWPGSERCLSLLLWCWLRGVCLHDKGRSTACGAEEAQFCLLWCHQACWVITIKQCWFRHTRWLNINSELEQEFKYCLCVAMVIVPKFTSVFTVRCNVNKQVVIETKATFYQIINQWHRTMKDSSLFLSSNTCCLDY